jgi:hypothetical protein
MSDMGGVEKTTLPRSRGAGYSRTGSRKEFIHILLGAPCRVRTHHTRHHKIRPQTAQHFIIKRQTISSLNRESDHCEDKPNRHPKRLYEDIFR